MAAHTLLDARRKAADKKKVFDEPSWWASKAKWRRAVPRVFELKEAAEIACGLMASDSRWLDAKVAPILKAPK